MGTVLLLRPCNLKRFDKHNGMIIPKLKILQGDLFTADVLITAVNFLVITDMPAAKQANK
jgi:hypothetical protein